jgi:hypothetical protein
MRPWLVLLAVLAGACSHSASPAGSAQAPRPGCQVENAGPVIGYTYRDVPPPPPTAGPIADGVYDLVEIVRHTPESGPWSSDQMPAFRWTLRFATTERSSNHTSGTMDSAAEIPPSVACGGARFATFQNELRVEGGVKGIESVGYSAHGDTLLIVKPDGDGGVPLTYAFRRRS